MSRRYKGAVISATPPTTTGGDSGTAPGEWTLQQQMQAQGGSVWPNQPPPYYVEDVFSTWLYTGNGSTQTITNGIDLSTKGGMVWTKSRSNAQNNWIFDTVRGPNSPLGTNITDSVADAYSTYFSPATNIVLGTTTGYSLAQTTGGTNTNNFTYVGWTFRKQPKFFDIVTYTGNGSASQTVSHNLGSTPGCVIIRSLSSGNWNVWSKDGIYYQFGLKLNSSAAAGGRADYSADITSTTLDVGSSHLNQTSNTNGVTYVAYLFANNSGGFGLTGTDNVITCSSYKGNGSATGPTITLGYEPQWLLIKNADSTGDWQIIDNMRGMTVGGVDALLQADLSNAESSADYVSPTATGFQITSTSTEVNLNGYTYIYIAIRRGPMKVPTSGTSVFAPVAQFTTGSYPRPVVTNFPVDFAILGDRSSSWGYNLTAQDRLRGGKNALFTSDPTAENTGALSSFAYNTQFGDGWVSGSTNAIYECFQRAPSFFDVVCYTGTGSSFQTLTHNLGVVPTMMIVKARSIASNWFTYTSFTGNNAALYVNSSDSVYNGDSNYWNTTTPTSTQFTVGGYLTNTGATWSAYLFATLAGVSKVGTYTGTGTLTTINCGFTGGARFVLIKRTDASANWFVWDTSRGMVSGTDPSLALNTTSAESNANSVYTITTGFQLLASPSADVNTSGATYIYLAIA